MKRLPTLMAAKEEIKSLQSFIQLVEEYKPLTLQEEIFKSYAVTGSISKTTSIINKKRTQDRLLLIDAAFVTKTIKSKPADPLHRVIRTAYMNKTRHIRNK